MHEEVVDAPRVQPFEEVLGGDGAEVVLQLDKSFVDLVDELRLDRVREDRVAVLGDAPEVLLEIGEGTGGRRFCVTERHPANCTEDAPRCLRSRAGTRKWGNVPVVGSLLTGRWRSW